MKFILACVGCSREYDVETPLWRCRVCDSPISLKIEDYPELNRFQDIVEDDLTLWRYGKLIPFSDFRVSIGEGLTPVHIHSFRGMEITFKFEYFSPTGSFKDRGASAGVTRANALQASTIVEDSSGNAGLAYSAYAAAGGLRARIYVPEDAPPAKLRLVSAFNAELVKCRSREEASERAVSELKQGEMYVGHLWDPFFMEGIKTEVFELYEFSNIDFDAVVVPTASGSHLLGIYRGFIDLLEMGFIDELPAFIAVQSAGCSPVYEEFYGEKFEGDGSLADGLRIKNPPRMREILKVLRANGDVVVVNNDEIREAIKYLLKLGILVEPTSATSWAGMMKLESEYRKILMPLTGTGIKTAEKLQNL